jgi:NOL1/NOP2/sun family putative RNA methylase
MTQMIECVDKCFSALMTRYAEIIPDPNALKRCLAEPLPVAGWLNPLKVNADNYSDLLTDEKINFKPMSWCAEGFRFQPGVTLGSTWLYAAGLLQIQEEVSMLPSYVLAPTENDCVLDMCAAPGNKTSQMSVMMQNKGTLVANDINYNRLKALGSSIRRLSLMNINVTVNNAMSLPVGEPLFDKIMVDAPCSCEGTLRKNMQKHHVVTQANAERMAAIQIPLLKKAFALLKPGGTMVYSTCTFAPEENEAVIDTLLSFAEGQLTCDPISLPGFKVSSGITSWRGRNYHPSVKNAWRIWPHFNDTGGFFIALLKKQGEAVNPVSPPVIPLCTVPKIAEYLDEMQQRFAIKDNRLSGVQFLKTSKRGIFLTNADNKAVFETFMPAVKFDSKGMFFLKTQIRYPKLSSAASMWLGPSMQKHIVILTNDQLKQYCRREDVMVDKNDLINCSETGYVVVKYKDYFVGMGLLFWRDTDQILSMRSLFPKYL